MAQPRTFPFTDDRIAVLPTPRKRVEYSDTICQGLKLRVGTSGVRTFMSYGRDAAGKRTYEEVGRWSQSGLGGTYTVETARARYLDMRGAKAGRGSETTTVGELLDLYESRGQVSKYTLDLLKKHLAGEPRNHVASTLAPHVLPDLVAKVQAGYVDEAGKKVGGAAVADKVRSGLVSLFEWAQRQGRYPRERALPTMGLVREDFKGIGWKPKERVPSERELHQLFDALGVGQGVDLTIDLAVTHRIATASRLAILLIMHVPVRSGVGVLTQPASAADLDARVLRWATHKGGRDEDLEVPLSDVASKVIRELRALKGGERWLIPSPEDPDEHIDPKALTRVLKRLQSPGKNGEAPRIVVDEGEEPFTPHALRALWATLAGDLGVPDGVIVRVLGHAPQGASKAQPFYDFSERVDPQREAVEVVSDDLERIRQRLPRARVEKRERVITVGR